MQFGYKDTKNKMIIKMLIKKVLNLFIVGVLLCNIVSKFAYN